MFGHLYRGPQRPARAFLKWDPAVAPAAPVGFIGDPNVDHPVVGSPFNTNFVRVEGLGLAVVGNQANTCTPATTDCMQSNPFSFMGKKATRAGSPSRSRARASTRS